MVAALLRLLDQLCAAPPCRRPRRRRRDDAERRQAARPALPGDIAEADRLTVAQDDLAQVEIDVIAGDEARQRRGGEVNFAADVIGERLR